jgi:hypothetical protein
MPSNAPLISNMFRSWIPVFIFITPVFSIESSEALWADQPPDGWGRSGAA